MRTTLTLLTALTLSTAAYAQAPLPCGSYAAFSGSLTHKYGERPVAYATPDRDNARTILELWSNPETGTYTIVSVSISPTRAKSACTVAAGQLAPQPARLSL